MRIKESRVRNAGGLLIILVVMVVLFCSSSSGVEADNSVDESSRSSADEKYEKYQKAAEELLYGSVHKNYLAKIRPPDNFPEPVPVEVSITLVHIRDLAVKKKELESVVDVKISWPDKRLAWNNDDITIITKHLHEVWYPPVICLNAAKESKPLFNTKLMINKEGIVTWQNRHFVTLICKSTDLRPNGTQHCDISLGFSTPETREFAFSDVWYFYVDRDFFHHRWDVVSYTLHRAYQFQKISIMMRLIDKKFKKKKT